MAFSESEERRIQAIERSLNSIQTALNNLATKQLVKSLLYTEQHAISQLQEEIDTLEAASGVDLINAHKVDSDAHSELFAEKAELIHQHDDRYFQETEFINNTTGITDANKPIKTDIEGLIDASFFDIGDISHADLSDIGSNTHVSIDSHLASGEIHYTEASIDTDNINEGDTNLFFTDERAVAAVSSDTSYTLVDGSRPFIAPIGGVSPVADSDLATKGYIDTELLDYPLLDGTRAFSGNVTVSGELTVDDSIFTNGNITAHGQFAPINISTYTPTGTTQVIDFNTGNFQILDLDQATGTVDVSFTNILPGGSYAIKVIQGSSVARDISITGAKWAGGSVPVITATLSAIDIISIIYDGSTPYCGILQDLK
jgi:hypothetical protein